MTVLRCASIDDYDGPPPEDFDPVTFHAEQGDLAAAARHLKAGDVYRKSLLGLDTAGAAELARHLATHGLELVDDETHWVVVVPAPQAPAPQAWTQARLRNDSRERPAFAEARVFEEARAAWDRHLETCTVCDHEAIPGAAARRCPDGRDLERRYYSTRAALEKITQRYDGGAFGDRGRSGSR